MVHILHLITYGVFMLTMVPDCLYDLCLKVKVKVNSDFSGGFRIKPKDQVKDGHTSHLESFIIKIKDNKSI